MNENLICSKYLFIKWRTFNIAILLWGSPFFVPETRNNNLNFQIINENQICSKCLVIKWESFIRKSVEKKLFPLGEKRENTLKKGPPKQLSLWGPQFFVPDTRGSTLMKIKFATNVQL